MKRNAYRTVGKLQHSIHSVVKVAIALAIALPSFNLRPPSPAHGQVVVTLPDFGDAPDSITNHPNVATNSAYPGVAGNFPTVWEGTLPFGAAGPKHIEPQKVFLGLAVSGEQDADLARINVQAQDIVAQLSQTCA